MRNAGASYRVSKNKLAKIATEGTAYSSINDLLTGPTALSTSVDPVAPAKVIVDFAKENDQKPALKGGVFEGKAVDAAMITKLAAIPPRDVLLAMVAGAFQAPLGGLLGCLEALKSQRDAAA